ncbi:YdcF family protein [Streptomyces sp. V4-01]|uniref:YdcF family protein n=1 Tax=Actinacidiphila polyblastidii TaxID=3110430 RepID=A0ABU7PJ99_9ACTN|nr:YdcF family protein [Streptomyces sp. V4-01]
MLAYAPALLCFLVFCVGVLRERRRFGNAVFLGLAVVFTAAAWLYELHRAHPHAARDVGVALLALVALGIVVLAWFLISNGAVMVRKEGASPANLLSLAAGLSLVALLVLLCATVVSRDRALTVVTGTAVALAGYLGFLFLCFAGYAFVYGHLHLRRRADFVVVLGSGLVDGSTVPPLLASRLEKARVVHQRLSRRGRRPVVLITSGGQGPDEDLPESHAMADHLVAGGFPDDLIAREDRSTSTEENVRFSRSIMEKANPDYRCVIVTNNYHAFRAAMISRREGVRGHVVGSPTAGYFLPSAMIREFAAVFLAYRRTNLSLCLLVFLGGAAIWWLG